MMIHSTMKHLNEYQSYEQSISEFIKGLCANEEFRLYCIKYSPLSSVLLTSITPDMLIEGLCGEVVSFTQKFFPEAEGQRTYLDDQSEGHAWIYYEGRCYDGEDYMGVDTWEELVYFDGVFDEEEMEELRNNLIRNYNNTTGQSQ